MFQFTVHPSIVRGVPWTWTKCVGDVDMLAESVIRSETVKLPAVEKIWDTNIPSFPTYAAVIIWVPEPAEVGV
jgi:hypothetical protein